MDIDKPQLKFIGIFVAAVVAFVAYQKLSSKSYPPIVFLGETYKHIEDVSPNEHVHTHLFSLGGAPVGEFDRWIQITNLSSEASREQRDTVDRQIKSTMNVVALPGSADRLFGVLNDVAVYVLMLLMGIELGIGGIFGVIIATLVLLMPYIGAISKSIWANFFFKYDEGIAQKAKQNA